MVYRFLFMILFCACCEWACSQTVFKNSKDSLLFTMGDKAFALANKNSDSALLLANKALHEASAIKNDRAIANAFNALGWTMMHRGHLDSSVAYLRKAWQLFNASQSPDDIVRVSINLAEVYTKQGKLSEAIQYLTRADSICVKTGNLPFHTNVKRQLGIVYRESGDHNKASEYLTEALEGFARLGDHFRYVGSGISLSILYRNLKMMDSSLSVLNRCLILAKRETKVPYQVAMVEEHLAETYFAKNNFGEALKHYQAAYNIFEEINNKADVAFESFLIGRVLIKMNRFEEAEKYLLESYHINDTLKMLNYQFDASNELAVLYKKTKHWEKAYQYLQKASDLKDSLGISEQKQKTNELKEKFETEKKEQEITLLKTQNELADATNKRTKLLQYIFILLFVASVIIGWLALNRSRMKKKLEAQLLRNQIAGDLHDDIGSALSSIDINSRIALVKQGDSNAMKEQLLRIQQHARKTMDSMSDIVWSINPQNDNFESMLMRMREFAAELCETMKIDLQFFVAPGIDNISLSTDKRKNIFLIYKEAVNNAVKYSECTDLTVALSKTSKDALSITIADNGHGFDEATIRKGNGLHNMKARAEHLQGVLTIYSEKGKGTSIRLSCPV